MIALVTHESSNDRILMPNELEHFIHVFTVLISMHINYSTVFIKPEKDVKFFVYIEKFL